MGWITTKDGKRINTDWFADKNSQWYKAKDNVWKMGSGENQTVITKQSDPDGKEWYQVAKYEEGKDTQYSKADTLEQAKYEGNKLNGKKDEKEKQIEANKKEADRKNAEEKKKDADKTNTPNNPHKAVQDIENRMDKAKTEKEKEKIRDEMDKVWKKIDSNKKLSDEEKNHLQSRLRDIYDKSNK